MTGATVTSWSGASRASGFTLTELVIVIAVILALLGFGLPAYAHARRQAQVEAARQLVLGVATAIEAYGARMFPLSDPLTGRVIANHPLWDTDRDGLLDGRNDAPAAVSAAGYRGFLDTVRPAIASSPRFVEASTRRVIDPWKRPLRVGLAATAGGIAAAAGIYGGSWFGIYSEGPNRRDDGGSGDDICNWK